MIPRSWKDLIDRVRGVAHNQRGIAFIRIIVLVDAEGNPLIWAEPKMTKLEPAMRAKGVLEELDRLAE